MSTEKHPRFRLTSASVLRIIQTVHRRGVNEKLDLEAAIDLARKEPVLLLTSDGKEFLLAEADDFEREVETLRGSHAFQRFLDERSQCTRRMALEEIEAEIEKELTRQQNSPPH